MGKLELKRPVAFIIWPHGLPYLDKILDMIFGAEQIEITRIVKKYPANINRLVKAVYKHDNVDSLHLLGKVRYLKSMDGPIFLILVQESGPILHRSGLQRNIIESERIKNLKSEIRLEFNPRDANELITHDHVIHTTDSEEDALRLLDIFDPGFLSNYKMSTMGAWGLDKFFIGDGIEVAREKFLSQDLYLESLSANIRIDTTARSLSLALSATPHYRFLCGDRAGYHSYISLHRGVAHRCYYSERKFDILYHQAKIDRTLLCGITVKKYGDGFKIVDGLHRAVIALYLGEKKISCEVVSE